VQEEGLAGVDRNRRDRAYQETVEAVEEEVREKEEVFRPGHWNGEFRSSISTRR
jgi:hypothetical protein